MVAPNVVEIARGIALEAHAGDRNKHDGELYLLHVHRVAVLARQEAPEERRENAEALAWLHDVVEDTSWTLHDVRVRFNQNLVGGVRVDTIVNALDAITKRKGESNEEYYYRVKANPLATTVKLHADMVDNFRRNHNIKDEATRARMAAKYSLGVDILSN